ncbi:hypothetical protein M0802_013619 [Mischocyttarus mexicanus]|nr:hypothetical protein M0802_013619 [Mischocyttarus mexicanus]
MRQALTLIALGLEGRFTPLLLEILGLENSLSTTKCITREEDCLLRGMTRLAVPSRNPGGFLTNRYPAGTTRRWGHQLSFSLMRASASTRVRLT